MPPGPELGRLLATAHHADLVAADTLCWLRACERQEAYVAACKADVLAHFADLNGELDPVEKGLLDKQISGAPRLVQVGGDGTPRVHEFCFSELAAVLRCSESRAEYLVADALDLRHRLTGTLARLRVGKLSGFRASLIARQSRRLPAASEAQLEDRLGATVCRVGYKRLRAEVEALLIDLDPAAAARRAKEAAERRYVRIERDDPEDGGTCYLSGRIHAFGAAAFDHALDTVAGMLKSVGVTGGHEVLRAQALGWLANPAAALRLAREAAAATDDGDGEEGPVDCVDPELWPQATVYLHPDADKLTRDQDGSVILEGYGPITSEQTFQALRHHKVKLRPVIDLHHVPKSGSDRFTGGLREAVILKSPTTAFPYSDHASRKADLDHSRPRGPTSIDNTGPLTRRQHRVKTHGRWTHVQLANGIYLWRSSHGRLYLVDRQGHTHDLGDEFRPSARSIPRVATPTTTRE